MNPYDLGLDDVEEMFHKEKNNKLEEKKYISRDDKKEPIKQQKKEKYRSIEKIGSDIEEIRDQLNEALRDERKIALYKLNYKATERDIFEFFAKSGVNGIVDIEFKRDKNTRKSKGVAFLEFQTYEQVCFALTLNGTYMMGQDMIIKHLTNSRAKTIFQDRSKIKEIKKDQFHSFESRMKIFVSGLVDNLAGITKEELKSLFDPFGEIMSIDLPKDKLGKSIGHGFIEYSKKSSAIDAINAMHKLVLKGQILRVGEGTDAMVEVGAKYGENDKEVFIAKEEHQGNVLMGNSVINNNNQELLVPSQNTAMPPPIFPFPFLHPMMMGMMMPPPQEFSKPPINFTQGYSQINNLNNSNNHNPNLNNEVNEKTNEEENEENKYLIISNAYDQDTINNKNKQDSLINDYTYLLGSFGQCETIKLISDGKIVVEMKEDQQAFSFILAYNNKKVGEKSISIVPISKEEFDNFIKQLN